MGEQLAGWFTYLGGLLGLTLGTLFLCGLAVRLCAVLFSALWGSRSDSVFDITAVIGTPVHELGHAAMCLLFGHRIQRVRLWSPRARNGMYGFVEHTYHLRNPWARLGNLFIAVGPLFSGLGVTVLTLWLCFPSQWADYLTLSRSVAQAEGLWEALGCSLTLLGSIPRAFLTDWLRSLIGVLVLLSVSLHISLSWQDVKSALSALPLYLGLTLIFGTLTYLLHRNTAILSALTLLNVRVLALFTVVLAVSLVWILLALLIRLIRMARHWF
ncbi:MAG: M50 family metallopeptidase [Clostridia bacterium]|nr:M50 family metallopeptidase [Clostridia bacterium]